MGLYYLIALSMSPSKSRLRNRGSFSLGSSSPAVCQFPLFSGSVAASSYFPVALVQGRTFQGLHKITEVWCWWWARTLGFQIKIKQHLYFFFFPLGKVFFSLFFVSFYPRSVDLIRTVLYTLAYTSAIVLYSRAKCWHCKIY